MKALLAEGRLLVATVALRGIGFIGDVKRAAGVDLWEVTRENRDELPERVVRWIRSRTIATT